MMYKLASVSSYAHVLDNFSLIVYWVRFRDFM
jgi:hypothetical protein